LDSLSRAFDSFLQAPDVFPRQADFFLRMLATKHQQPVITLPAPARQLRVADSCLQQSVREQQGAAFPVQRHEKGRPWAVVTAVDDIFVKFILQETCCSQREKRIRDTKRDCSADLPACKDRKYFFL
jgi:hypothetical protein